MSDPQDPPNPYDPNQPQGHPQGQPYGQPQGQPYGQPQPGYGQPGVPWQPPPPDHPQATLILVLGILGLVLCQVLGPFAWVMGSKARKEIQASNGAIGGDTQVTIGWVLGIVASALLIIAVLFFVLYLIGIAVFIGSSGEF